MREIKFRVWDKKNKRMMNWIDSIIWNSMGIESVKQTTPLQGHARKIEDVELMQYTGRNDKNGVEIYEGDIVREWNGDMREIVFNSSRAAFIAKMCPKPMVDMPTWIRRIKEPEVISNIYENPELLVKKDK